MKHLPLEVIPATGIAFTGPRGAGKDVLARKFEKIVLDTFPHSKINIYRNSDRFRTLVSNLFTHDLELQRLLTD